MGGHSLTLTVPVEPDTETDITIGMTAPINRSGKIQGSWRMADTSGIYFGDVFTVVIMIE